MILSGADRASAPAWSFLHGGYLGSVIFPRSNLPCLFEGVAAHGLVGGRTRIYGWRLSQP